MHIHRSYYYFIAAAAAIAIAGILHLILASNVITRGASLFGIFFIVAGLAQLFWVLPMIKRWGRMWYFIGIAGTIILMIIYAITRIPNPITGGRAVPVNEIGGAVMVVEGVYIILPAIILVKERELQVSEREKTR